MKVATFNVRATLAQSVRWKQAAAGYSSVGAWIADAVDCHLKARAREGRPLPLVWRIGRVTVRLDAEPVTFPGYVSPPFGAFRGDIGGRVLEGCHHYSLVYLPATRLIATLRTYRQCKALASELAPVLIRGEPLTPSEGIIERHRREAV